MAKPIDQPFPTTEPSTLPTIPPRERRDSPVPWLILGIVTLAVVYLLRDTGAPSTATVVQASQPPVPTIMLALELPAVETMTTFLLTSPTPTAIPTLYPTAAATVDPSILWCSNMTPRAGQACQMPPAPTPTDIPRPECPTKPGAWCVFPPTDDTNGEVETR
jgi:hypothetical protein